MRAKPKPFAAGVAAFAVLVLVACGLAARPALAQAAATATVTIEPAIPAAKAYFTIALTVENADSAEAQSLPPIEGIRVVQGPNFQRSMQYDGRRMVTSITYSWRVIADEPGEYTIPAVPLTIGSRQARTEPHTFRVRPPGADRDPALLREQYKESLFVTAEVSSAEPYVGQPIVLTFRLWVADVRINYHGLESPPISGFLQEKLGDERRYRRPGKGGKVFTIVERSSLLYPIEPGDRAIAPVEAAIELLVTRDDPRRRRLFGDFDDPFGILDSNADPVPLSVRSEPITVKVKPLPEEGKPGSFAGAVGEFDMTANVSHREVAAGDPVTVSVELRGRGNFRNMGRPGFAARLDGFREYEPERKENVDVTEQGLFGTVTYTQAIVPEKPGSTEIPAVEFAYFDVAKGAYRTLRSGPFPLTVTEGKGPARPVVSERGSGAPGGTAIEILAEDVLPVLAPPPAFRRAEPPSLAALAAAALAPLASLAAAALVARRRERFRLDPLARRREAAAKVALARLRESGGPDGAARAVAGFVADRLSLPAATATPAEVARLLEERGGASLAAETRDFLEECDRLRFARAAGAGAETEAADLGVRAEALLRKLREALRR